MIKTLKRKLSIFFIATTIFFFTIVMGLMAYILVQSHNHEIQTMTTSILRYIRYDLEEGKGKLSLDDLMKKYSISVIETTDYSNPSISISRAAEHSPETETTDEAFNSQEDENVITGHKISGDGSVYIVTAGSDGKTSSFIINIEKSEDNMLTKKIIIVLVIYVLGMICIVLLCRVFVKAALTPLEETLLRQSGFISSVSHEFRNPLSVIQNSTSLVKSVHGSELGIHMKYLDNITNECTRLSKLLDTMLSYISFNQKAVGIQKEQIKFEDFLIDIYPFLTELCRAKEIQLDVNLPKDYSLPEVEMNKLQMTELFVNLVDNAVSFSPAKSSVTINTYIDKKAMYVEVIDEGTGISKSDKELAFEAFYCGDKSRTNKGHFGLGLTIVKDIANNHNAKIKLLDSPAGGCSVQIIFSLS